MTRANIAMHVDRSRRHYTAADGSVRVYRRDLLRRSYRDERGRPQKETLANLSALPEEAVEAIRKILSGVVLVEANSAVEIERALPHGDVAAVHAMATRLGIKKLLGPECRERDLAYALIISRIVRPGSKLSTTSWWDDTTLGADLAVTGAGTDEVYHAMDWLLARQEIIETALARRHPGHGGMALFDLSSSWLEGGKCELGPSVAPATRKRGCEQIEYGLLTDMAGRPVAIRVFPGDTSDTAAFVDAVAMVRDQFALERITMVGDRGMMTNARVNELRELGDMNWITALRAPAIAALARDDGPLQMSLSDTQNFAEITHPDYPAERLICCRNPALAVERARQRDSLLQATDKDLATIAARVESGTLAGQNDIGVAAGKIINKHKAGKHFILTITDTAFTYRRDHENIDAEAQLDGLYVLRTSLGEQLLDTPDVIAAYKNLAHVERDFRVIKIDDLDLRPIFHYITGRVHAHVFLCMLAAYLVWHLRDALAELTFADENIPHRSDPVLPAGRSPAAKTKDARKQTPDGLPVRSFRDLLGHLKTLNRETLSFAGQRLQKITNPTATQRRVFELIGAPIPLTLT